MGTRERAIDRGTRRGRTLAIRFGQEIRQMRVASGLSQRALGAVVGVSHTQIGRIEHAALSCDILLAARVCAVLGLELSVSTHPVASPLRDRAHLALLARLAERLHPSFTWRTEVPLPLAGDLRAMDGWLANERCRAMVEAETRFADGQGSERRARLKQRDAGGPRLILLLADSRFNRAAVAAVPGLEHRFPISGRRALAALGRGNDPGGDCLILL
ncbi:MAG TPA: helix-turn-helix transcriptional regulator [Candidatus Limnocylindria bacterium]|nr:helix-turn-helix transcriptional regulator [Candidatus Limnocylindria bacterium]